MRKFAGTAFIALALLVPAAAIAQVGVLIGAGATIPTGDYGKYASTGWATSLGIRLPIGTGPLGVVVEGFYGSNAHEIDGDKTTLMGALGTVIYRLGDPTRPGIFLGGSAGMLVHKYTSDNFPDEEGSETQPAFGAGIGYVIPKASARYWLMGRYIHSPADDGNTTYMSVAAGITINLGGR
jgi:hypothetical protein